MLHPGPRLVRAGVAAAALLVSCGASEQPGPNVLLISIDTLRADHLGCYGYERPTSPRLDELARAGVVYGQVVSPSNWTLPSHASLLTGRMPARHALLDDGVRLDAGVPTLAEGMRAAGYHTLGVVAHVYVSRAFGLERGFDVFDDGLIAGGTTNPVAAQVVDRVLAHVDEAPPGPLFLFVHLFDPHWSYTPPAPWDTAFTDPDYAGPMDGSYARMIGVEDPGAPIHRADLDQLVALYDGEIASTDAQIGRLLDGLVERGLLEDAVVVVTGDHGEEFKDHGALGHGKTLFEEQLRVPLILAGHPGLPPGTRREDPVSTVDIAPTLLALAGAERRADLFGRDLADRPAGSRLLVSETQRFGYTMRAGRLGPHKLIRNLTTGREAYFDLAGDPGEGTELAVDPTGGTLASALAAYSREADSGWHLRLASWHDRPMHVTLTVTSEGRLSTPRAYFSRNIVGSEAVIDTLDLSRDGRQLRVAARVRNHMGEIVFTTDPADASIRLDLRVEGGDPSAGAFLASGAPVGPSGSIDLDPGDERLAGEGRRTATLQGLVVRWVGGGRPGEQVELPPDVRQHLRELGYAGPEDG
ncbi:MAG: sulfatase [Planctomycetota bacterium]|jgi:arylsulfatase A-like enzyme